MFNFAQNYNIIFYCTTIFISFYFTNRNMTTLSAKKNGNLLCLLSL
jgi:hypothetical protein